MIRRLISVLPLLLIGILASYACVWSVLSDDDSTLTAAVRTFSSISVLIIGNAVLHKLRADPDRPFGRFDFKGILVAIPLFATAAFGWWLINSNNLERVVTLIYRSLGTATSGIATAVLFVLGWGLFRLKRRRLLIYAHAELSFALLSCYAAVDRARHTRDLAVVIAIASSAYLAVRGLENRDKAIEANTNAATTMTA